MHTKNACIKIEVKFIVYSALTRKRQNGEKMLRGVALMRNIYGRRFLFNFFKLKI